MTKQDLRSGMVVETREGGRYLVLVESGVCTRESGYLRLDDVKDDLTGRWYSKFDIVKVYENGFYTLEQLLEGSSATLWSRYEEKELTVSEIEKLLGYPVKIVKE